MFVPSPRLKVAPSALRLSSPAEAKKRETENPVLLAMKVALQECQKSGPKLKWGWKWKWWVVCKIERVINNAFGQDFQTRRRRLGHKTIEGFCEGQVSREVLAKRK